MAFEPAPLAAQLEAYGEPEAAAKMLAMSADTHMRISVAAGRLLSQDLTIDKAICLAAVEVFEGAPRDLRRKRRVYSKSARGPVA